MTSRMPFVGVLLLVVALLSAASLPGANQIFIATFKQGGWDKASVQNCFYNFFHNTPTINIEGQGAVVSPGGTTESVTFTFGGIKGEQNNADMFNYLTTFPNISALQEVFSPNYGCNRPLLDLILKPTTPPAAPAGPKSFLEEYPEVIAGAIAGVLLIIGLLVLLMLHQRAKKHAQLRDTMEAMMDDPAETGDRGQQPAPQKPAVTAPRKTAAKSKGPAPATGAKRPAEPTGPKRDSLAPKVAAETEQPAEKPSTEAAPQENP